MPIKDQEACRNRKRKLFVTPNNQNKKHTQQRKDIKAARGKYPVKTG